MIGPQHWLAACHAASKCCVSAAACFGLQHVSNLHHVAQNQDRRHQCYCLTDLQPESILFGHIAMQHKAEAVAEVTW